MKYTLSIIIPVFNCSKYIERCVESIIKSIGAEIHLQIIIVNDGSTDDSDIICKKLADSYSDITYISQTNKGASSARNAGLKVAVGDYIWFVDADDQAHPSIQSIIPSLIENLDNDVISFNYAEETPDGLNMIDHFKTKQFFSTALYLENNRALYLWNKIFKRESIGEIRFLEGTKNIEDFLFNIEVLINAKSICCVSEYGYIYNTCNQQSTSRSISKKNLIKLSQDSFTVHKHLFGLIPINAKNKKIVQNLLSFSIAGHFYSLFRFYNLRRIKMAISEYEKAGLYPVVYTNNAKANILLFIINSFLFRAVLRILTR